MKPLEFGASHYTEVFDKLVIGIYKANCAKFDLYKHIGIQGNGIAVGANVFMYIGETEAFNSTHERWCQSKELIETKGITI
jgi:hypothetical protein